VKPSSADAESRVAPRPPTDPNRQLSRTGARPRNYHSHNAGDPQSPLYYDLGHDRLKSESLNDGIIFHANAHFCCDCRNVILHDIDCILTLP